MRLAARTLTIGICAVACGVAAGGCGVDIGTGGAAANPPEVQRGTSSEQRQRDLRGARLPARAAGEVAIAGEQQGSLSSNAAKDFAAAQRQVRPRYGAVGATEGFARLCRGEVDVVDSARPISRAELAVCNANGLEIRTPIQIASDALVVATRNESDVGGDCLTIADLREIYRRGSTIRNWSQLGFDDLPLKATGPNQSANAFGNFASQVLGTAGGATLDDLRGDYRPRASDDEIRRAIIGMDTVRRVPGLVEQDVHGARRAAARQRRVYVGSAVVSVRERVLRAIRVENRRRARRKEAVADPAALARHNLRRINDAKRQAADRARKRFDRRFDVLRDARTRDLLARTLRNGVVGIVRFSYYEAFEDQLRPLEIDAGPAGDAVIAAADARARAAGTTPPKRLPAVDGDGNRIPNCVFPSQLTLTTGEYPLSRRILLYTSTRGLQRAEVRAFLAYTLRNAQQLATRSRLVPITNRLRADQYRFVTDSAIAPEDERLPGEGSSGKSAPGSQPVAPSASDGASTVPAPPAAPASSVPGVSSGASAAGGQAP
ncbi:MAG: phosphate transport system substrate-binding protein [Solirubrobacteraceae bacterium]|jgi:ABC-type phosphate transport system substrate-binding protein|nr:phosphate transport system substrate-binding protein [Solirubrobacteraceae bacterium]